MSSEPPAHLDSLMIHTLLVCGCVVWPLRHDAAMFRATDILSDELSAGFAKESFGEVYYIQGWSDSLILWQYLWK